MVETEVAAAEARIRELVAAEVAERTAELERTLARSRADALSEFAAEERRLSAERRQVLIGHEKRLGDELAARLVEMQRGVEQKLAAWAADLERAQQALEDRLGRLDLRARQRITESETRFEREAVQADGLGEEQRVVIVRLRADLELAVEDLGARTTAELESHASERRRALHNLEERLQRRERELVEAIDREATEAQRRAAEIFPDIERSQVEALERVVGREVTRFAEVAAAQFDEAVRGEREEAARRFSRELEHAVESFAKEAETVLAVQLAQVSEAGVQRLEGRLSDLGTKLELQRDELVGSFERRFDELARRTEETATRARERLAELDSSLRRQ